MDTDRKKDLRTQKDATFNLDANSRLATPDTDLNPTPPPTSPPKSLNPTPSSSAKQLTGMLTPKPQDKNESKFRNSALFIAFKYIFISIFVGIIAGTFIAAYNGSITENYTSESYFSQAAIDNYVNGITLAYTQLFVISAVIMMAASRFMPIFYPFAGLIAVYVALTFRGISGALGTLDCGYSCVDTILPMSAQQRATEQISSNLFISLAISSLIYILIIICMKIIRKQAKQ